MCMGFAPTWLRQVSPMLHKTTLTTAQEWMFPPAPVGIWPSVSTRGSTFLSRFLYSVLHPTDPRFADLEPPTPFIHYSDVETVNISISVKL